MWNFDLATPANMLRAWRAFSNVPDYPETFNLLEQLDLGGMGARQTARRGYSSTCPGLLLCYNAQEAVLFVGGSNGSLAQRFVRMGIASPVGHWELGVTPAVAASVAEILPWLAGIVDVATVRWSIYGHSFGGACAAGIVVGLLRLGASRDNIRAVTVGSCRPGSNRLATILNGSYLVSILSNEDAVPLVLPHSDESPTLHAFLSSVESQRANAHLPIGSAIQLFADGAESGSEIPSGVGPQTAYAIGSWATNTFLGRPTSHDWNAYHARFVAWNDRVVPAPPRVIAPLLIQGIPEARTGSRDAAVIAARRAAQASLQGDPSIIRHVADSLLFEVERREGEWALVWMDHTVATYWKRTQAYRSKKHGNILLRSMTFGNEHSYVAWTFALQAFLASASEFAGEYQPPLNVTGIP